jgi:hypothetical protein
VFSTVFRARAVSKWGRRAGTFPQAIFVMQFFFPRTLDGRIIPAGYNSTPLEGKMTKMRIALIALAIVVTSAVPVMLYGQSELVPPQTEVAPAATGTGCGFTIAADATSGGVWRLNSSTGELWFCLASGTPQCHLAVNAKK